MFQKKSTAPTAAHGVKPVPAPADAASKGAHAPLMGCADGVPHMALPDKMTAIPKLAGHEAIGAAHKHNTMRQTERFGTDTEKMKARGDAAANYPGCSGDDCPVY